MDSTHACRIFTLIAILLVGIGHQTRGQSNVDDQVNDMMETAIAHMNDGEYEEANLTFRKILKLNTVLPDELSYLFAETLYMVNQYHNSKNFLDKYIRLAGSTGRYYSQAIDLKHFLDQEYELILVCKLCDNRGYRLIGCDVCDYKGKLTSQCFYCRGVGINRCEVCKGNGVTTSLNAFGEVLYQTCNDCQGKGQTVCKVCHGAKVIHEECEVCHGTSKKAGNEICDHQPTGNSKVFEPIKNNGHASN
ncbi:MAG: hypothetical protein DHS20C17_32260 [Cyclobacteriaceae bacterium]|nr:MAG: hypothetical protein DHS20C17_32260 [Cyclobacteriaceae bacterium]